MQLERLSERELLGLYLTGRDVLCPECGYNLRGVGGGPAWECPECAARLGLRLASGPAVQGLWMRGLMGLVVSALVAGLGGMALAQFGQAVLCSAALGGAGVYVAGVMRWARWAGRFSSLTGPERRMRVWASWALPAAVACGGIIAAAVAGARGAMGE